MALARPQSTGAAPFLHAYRHVAGGADPFLSNQTINIGTVTSTTKDLILSSTSASVVFNASNSIILTNGVKSLYIISNGLEKVMPKCQMINTGNQTSIVSSVFTQVIFNTITYDPDSMTSLTNNSVTIEIAGLYGFYAQTCFSTTNTTNYRSIDLYKNGTCVAECTFLPGDSVTPVPVHIDHQDRCLIGDVWNVYCYQNSGGTLTIGSTTVEANQSIFNVTMLSL
jgi:hypothetical protein